MHEILFLHLLDASILGIFFRTMDLLPVLATTGERSRQASRHVRDARAHAGIASERFPLRSVAGKTLPANLAHAQPAIARIWQEVHEMACYHGPPTHEVCVRDKKITWRCISGIKNESSWGVWCRGCLLSDDLFGAIYFQ